MNKRTKQDPLSAVLEAHRKLARSGGGGGGEPGGAHAALRAGLAGPEAAALVETLHAYHPALSAALVEVRVGAARAHGCVSACELVCVIAPNIKN